MGRKYQSQKDVLKRLRRKKSAIGSANSLSWPFLAMPVVSWLKRTMSFNIRQNAGLARLLRWAKTVLRLLPLHSSWLLEPAPGICTENDMSEGAVSTPRSANRRIRRG